MYFQTSLGIQSVSSSRAHSRRKRRKLNELSDNSTTEESGQIEVEEEGKNVEEEELPRRRGTREELPLRRSNRMIPGVKNPSPPAPLSQG